MALGHLLHLLLTLSQNLLWICFSACACTCVCAHASVYVCVTGNWTQGFVLSYVYNPFRQGLAKLLICLAWAQIYYFPCLNLPVCLDYKSVPPHLFILRRSKSLDSFYCPCHLPAPAFWVTGISVPPGLAGSFLNNTIPLGCLGLKGAIFIHKHH